MANPPAPKPKGLKSSLKGLPPAVLYGVPIAGALAFWFYSKRKAASAASSTALDTAANTGTPAVDSGSSTYADQNGFNQAVGDINGAKSAPAGPAGPVGPAGPAGPVGPAGTETSKPTVGTNLTEQQTETDIEDRRASRTGNDFVTAPTKSSTTPVSKPATQRPVANVAPKRVPVSTKKPVKKTVKKTVKKKPTKRSSFASQAASIRSRQQLLAPGRTQ